MIKNILITGGAGYIGSHVAEYLIKKKFNVFIIDNLSTGYKKLINKKSKFIKKDLKQTKGLRQIILDNKINSVIHLAASLDVSESQKNPSKYTANNVKSTINLIQACKDTLVTSFIFSSTAAVYKDGIYKVNEKSPTKPKSIYGKTKLKAENLIKGAFRVNKINSVIHLAASLNVNESQKNPSKYTANNIKSTTNLIKACKDTLVTSFIFSSTAAVYNDGIYKVNEKSPTRPKSIYGKTKLKAEMLIKKAFEDNKINYAILRFFNVCGASSSNKIGQINSYDLLFKNLAAATLKKKPSINIYGNDYQTKDGTCIRDFIHVSDLSEVNAKLLNIFKKIKKSIILNVGYGLGTTVLEVVKAFEKHSKKKIKINFLPRRKADLKQIIADNSKLKKFLNWKPKYNKLSIMVKSSIKWEKKISNL